MDRITRGFHRIGLVVAIPAAVIAIVVMLGTIFLYTPGEDRGGAYFVVICAAVIAVFWYGAARAAAWIINGFRGQPQ